MKHIIKKTITLLMAIIMAMGIITFERKTVDAAITQVEWYPKTMGVTEVGDSYTSQGVTMDINGELMYILMSDGSLGQIVGKGTVAFTAGVGKFTSISIQFLSGTDNTCPEGWSANEDTSVITWTGSKNKVEISGDVRLYQIYKFEFVMSIDESEPEVTKYPLYVGKNQVTSAYLKNETEGWSYDPASNTLYLDNAKITDTNTYIVTRDCISYKGSPSDVLTISLSGNSTVGDENAQYAIETYASSLIITGNGSLTINAEYEVIDSGISLTIKDVSITANTGGIFSMRGMVINNSTVTVSNGTLWNSEKSIKITDSRVEVTDEPYGVGIGSDYSNISISGDSYVKADVTGSESKEEKFAMLFVDSLELKDGVEIVEPEEAEISNYKLPGTTSNTYSIFEKGSTTPAQKVIIARTYTIKFVNDDGTELQSSKVITGEIPKYEGDTPTKPSDGKYEYTFKGWDKEITEAKADATYTAVFESKEITTPQPDPKPVTPFPIPKTGIE